MSTFHSRHASDRSTTTNPKDGGFTVSTTTLPIPRAREHWHQDALCAQTDPEAFFPEKGGTTRDAKQICRRCPVQQECLATALAHREHHGVWGGLSERERRPLLRQRTEVEVERLLAGGAR